MKLYHGSNEKIEKITADNNHFFYGVFANESKSAAYGHGEYIYTTYINENDICNITTCAYNNNSFEQVVTTLFDMKSLEDTPFEYDYDELLSGTASLDDMDQYLSPIAKFLKINSDDLFEISFECQNAAGKVAEQLGYKAVWQFDEHGWSVLCLPGTIFTIDKNELAIKEMEKIKYQQMLIEQSHK